MDGTGRVVGGRYTLVRLLGRGGMAEVWLATDARLGDKHVAVKKLLGTVGALDVERARREALAASRLNHGNLVAVTDFVADDGEPFIVMEYVDGTTLGDLVEADGPLSAVRAARLIGQIASAVAEAHEAGIVHRDIKPANIMVTRRDVAKLADFGIARSAGDQRLTQTGFFTGTVAYLAPELLDGSDATSASDVWGLGAVLFEIVEGRRAFAGESTPVVITAIALRDAPVSSSPELAPIIAAMLQRDPAQRMPIGEVADRLAALGGRGPVETGPTASTTVAVHQAAPPGHTPPWTPGPPPPSGPPAPSGPAGPPARRPRRGPWVVAAAVAVLVAGVIAFVATRGDDEPVAGPAAASPTASSPSVPRSSTSTGNGTTTGITVLAHRGGRESYAEETLASLVAAAKKGYGVETDVRWTSDGVPVLVHDAMTAPNLQCTGGSKPVAELTAAQLTKTCRTPAAASPDGKQYPPPTFDQVAAALADVPGATIFAEVKVTQTAKQVDEFLAILTRHGLVDRAVVTSFSSDELAKMAAAAKPLGTTLRLMRFVSRTPVPVAELRGEGLTFVAVENAIATKPYFAGLRAAGLKTVAYLADDDDQWRAAKANQADFVLTDVPAQYLDWVKNR